MPVFGMNNGVVPIIAYNYGARSKTRILKTVKLAAVFAFCMMLCGFAAFQLIPDVLLKFFNASDELLAIGCPALRTISFSYLVAGFCIVIGSVFQALGNGVYSLITSVCRQLLVLLPCAWILSRIAGLSAVWWAFPIAEIVSIIVSLILFRRIYQKKIKDLEH
jgi:Na+-driven multidrug efflux pump